MKLFMTGSSGQIAKEIIPFLVNEYGHEILGYDLEFGYDIFDLPMLDKMMEGTDVVIHMAGLRGPEMKIKGYIDEDFERINFGGSKNVFDTAVKKGIKRLIFISSNSVYGYSTGTNPPFPITDSTPTPQVLSSYAQCKLKTEDHLKKLCKKNKCVGVALRVGGLGFRNTTHPFPWHLSIRNLAKVINLSILTDKVKGFEWFNIMDKEDNQQVDTSKAERLLGY